MRLWSIHPKYLDSKGLVAVWREGLLAQKCLTGQTKGYTNHPQLNRFKAMSNSLNAIGGYLMTIISEAEQRNYNFDSSKILYKGKPLKMTVTTNQIAYEWQHFLKKIITRDPERHAQLMSIKKPNANPIFDVIPGVIADWEIIN